MELCEVTHDDMIFCKNDYRLILHDPAPNRKYYALKENGLIIACCELLMRKRSIHFDCVFVPEQFRGNGFAYILITKLLEKYKGNGFIANAQANNWSIKTFKKAGFNVKSQREFAYWTAYYVNKEVDNG